MTRTLVQRLVFGASLTALALGLSVQLGSADIKIEDHKLEAFIDAALAVDHVMDKWHPKIVRAKGSEEADKLHVKANAEIRETIDGADGISFDEYQKIRRAIVSNPDMLSRVTRIMWEQQGK